MSSTARRAVYFDRDNTLIVNDGYLGDPAGVVLMAGAAAAVARARRLGYAVVVVSNQSGVARGLMTEEDVRAVNRRVEELLLADHAGAVIDRQEYCPYHPEGVVAAYRMESELRKPAPGMIHGAARALGLSAGGWMVGDAARDIEAGRAAGLRTIFLGQDGGGGAEFVCGSLKEVMDVIERETEKPGGGGQDAVLREVLAELKRGRAGGGHAHEFSVWRLLGGLVQILVLAGLFLAWLNRGGDGLMPTLTVTLILQVMVVALVGMGRR